jgi:hypothetical protein
MTAELGTFLAREGEHARSATGAPIPAAVVNGAPAPPAVVNGAGAPLPGIAASEEPAR